MIQMPAGITACMQLTAAERACTCVRRPLARALPSRLAAPLACVAGLAISGMCGHLVQTPKGARSKGVRAQPGPRTRLIFFKLTFGTLAPHEQMSRRVHY